MFIKWNFMVESPGYGLSHPHYPKDHRVHVACALKAQEVTFSLAQRS